MVAARTYEDFRPICRIIFSTIGDDCEGCTSLLWQRTLEFRNVIWALWRVEVVSRAVRRSKVFRKYSTLRFANVIACYYLRAMRWCILKRHGTLRRCQMLVRLTTCFATPWFVVGEGHGPIFKRPNDQRCHAAVSFHWYERWYRVAKHFASAS